MNQTKHKPTPCPCCGRVLEDSTAVYADRKTRPCAGDLSVCFYCGAILEFAGSPDLELRALPITRLEKMPGDVRAQLRRGSKSGASPNGCRVTEENAVFLIRLAFAFGLIFGLAIGASIAWLN